MKIKPIHIIIIVLLGIGIGVVVSLYGNTTQYVSFNDAEKLGKENPNKEYHVVCKLNKAKSTKYDPVDNPNLTVFYAIDTLGIERRVEYSNARPADMDRAEKLVIIGKAKEGYFQASQILSKCPSKYEEEIKAEEVSSK